MQGWYIAEMNLATMFGTSGNYGASENRSRYWSRRASAKLEPEDAPGWTGWTSEHCFPSSRADRDNAVVRGEIAYQAMAMKSAACWFKISAAQGNLDSHTFLGVMYLFGYGVEKSRTSAFAEMKMAAEGGNLFGMAYLSRFYRYGIGTASDEDQAFYWYNKATVTDDGKLAWKLTFVPGDLTQEQKDDTLQSEEEHTRCMSKANGRFAEHTPQDCENQNPIRHHDALPLDTLKFPEEIFPLFGYRACNFLFCD